MKCLQTVFCATMLFVFAEKTTYANNTHCVINALNRALSPGKIEELSDQELLAEIEKNMLYSGLTFGPEDKAAFLEANRLKPLFNSGIVHDTFIQEFSARGYRNQKEVSALLQSFRLMPEADQVKIIDGVTDRLIHLIDDDVNLSNIKNVIKVAKQYKMSVEELTSFLTVWRKFKNTDYEEVKLVLFMKLMGDDKTFMKGITSRATWLSRLKRWASGSSNAVKIADRPSLIPSSVKSSNIPAYDREFFDTKEISRYVDKSKRKLADSFVNSNLSKFNLEQVEMLMVKTTRNSEKKLLGPETLERLKEREVLLKRAKDLDQKILSVNENKFPELEALQKQMGAHYREADIISKLDLVKSNNVIELSSPTPGNNFLSSNVPDPNAEYFKTHVLDKISSEVFPVFVEEARLFLNHDQLQVLKRYGRMSELPELLRNRVNARTDLFERMYGLQKEILDLDPDLNKERWLAKKLELEEAADLVDPNKAVGNEEFKVIEEQVQYRPSDNSKSYNELVRKTLDFYVQKISGEQFTRIALNIIHEARLMGEFKTEIALDKMIFDFSKKVLSLTDDQLNQIKKNMLRSARLFPNEDSEILQDLVRNFKLQKKSKASLMAEHREIQDKILQLETEQRQAAEKFMLKRKELSALEDSVDDVQPSHFDWSKTRMAINNNKADRAVIEQAYEKKHRDLVRAKLQLLEQERQAVQSQLDNPAKVPGSKIRIEGVSVDTGSKEGSEIEEALATEEMINDEAADQETKHTKRLKH